MLGNGSLKRFSMLSMIRSDFSLFIEIVMFSEFITKPRNSYSWVGFKIDFCSCILNLNFTSKFTVTSIFLPFSVALQIRVINKYDREVTFLPEVSKDWP